ncbi:MAG: hypothetical protein ACRC6A_03050 [Fusobacteriaceae bacterium]
MVKIILIFLLNVLIITAETEDVILSNVEQPFLSELGIQEFETNEKINYRIDIQEKEIESLKAKYEEIQPILKLNETRFEILDKVIADKNVLLDELNEKVENFKIELIKIQKESDNEKKELEQDFYLKIYKILGLIAGVVSIIFLILFSIIIYQNSKYKKSIEEWKEIIELNKKQF